MAEESITKEFKDDFALFIEAGFIAIKQLDEIAARRLFKAADLLSPGNLASQLGLGYIALNKLQVAEAAKVFEEILQKDPEHHLAQALLGICYLLSKNKRQKGEELILDAKARSTDPAVHHLADTCMEWAEKDLKIKAASPFAKEGK